MQIVFPSARKVAVIFLIFAILLTSFGPAAALPVFAAEETPVEVQEIVAPAEVPSEQPESSELSSEQSPAPEKEIGVEPEGGMETLLSEGDYYDPSSQYNNYSLAAAGRPEANAASGALNYAIPIAVPPGRSGLQPNLAIVYNSQAIARPSAYGSGWGDTIPIIERINRYGIEDMYSEDLYATSFDGELVDLGGGEFGAKVENGAFRKYELSGNVWTVTDKLGTTYKFGSTTNGRKDDPSDSSRVFAWYLQEVRDMNDNFIKYEWEHDQGQMYPERISYTGNGTTEGIFEVLFDTGSSSSEITHCSEHRKGGRAHRHRNR